MGEFDSPRDLKFNRGLIANPEAFARAANAASWPFLCGEEFAAIGGRDVALVTCRTGRRSSAVVYLYAGLSAGAAAEEVLARAEADNAPFCRSDELKAWVAQGLDELS